MLLLLPLLHMLLLYVMSVTVNLDFAAALDMLLLILDTLLLLPVLDMLLFVARFLTCYCKF